MLWATQPDLQTPIAVLPAPQVGTIASGGDSGETRLLSLLSLLRLVRMLRLVNTVKGRRRCYGMQGMGDALPYMERGADGRRPREARPRETSPGVALGLSSMRARARVRVGWGWGSSFQNPKANQRVRVGVAVSCIPMPRTTVCEPKPRELYSHGVRGRRITLAFICAALPPRPSPTPCPPAYLRHLATRPPLPLARPRTTTSQPPS